MGRDWGSRERDFVAMSERVRAGLTALVHGARTHTAVPLQGAGTFAIEAAIGAYVEERRGALQVAQTGAGGTKGAPRQARIFQMPSAVATVRPSTAMVARAKTRLRVARTISEVMVANSPKCSAPT